MTDEGGDPLAELVRPEELGNNPSPEGEVNQVSRVELLNNFTLKYSPNLWDTTSLDFRIHEDFASEAGFAGKREESTQGGGGGAPTVRGEVQGGKQCQIRAAEKVDLKPMTPRWVKVRGFELEPNLLVFPQVTHNLAEKGLQALQFTGDLAKNVPGGGAGTPAVCLLNKLPITFQVREGQRLGTLLPMAVPPSRSSGGPVGGGWD